MFIDQANVKVSAGNGGNGVMSFRRERYIDRGGPDGGDGGKGGDIIAKVKDSIHGLADYRNIKSIKAENGQAGGGQNKHGRNGADKIIYVPKGTIITAGDNIVADLTHDNDEAIIAKGGEGGFGNAHFKSSVRQAPKIAERGEPGEELELTLELKLIADVGLVGLPNAGKSTFLSVVSNAKPKIANYPFTTLVPNLGIADIDGDSLVIADIPGLIEGASEGKGLGDEFLRHVERTAALLHLVDINSDTFEEDYKTIVYELKYYKIDLSERPTIIAASKTDAMEPAELKKRLARLRKLAGQEILILSSPQKIGVDEVLRKAKAIVEEERQQQPAQEQTEATVPVFELSEKEMEDAWSVEKDGEVLVVSGAKIEKHARRLDLSDYYAQLRIKDIMHKTGIMHELSRKGAGSDSIVRIGNQEFPLQ